MALLIFSLHVIDCQAGPLSSSWLFRLILPTRDKVLWSRCTHLCCGGWKQSSLPGKECDWVGLWWTLLMQPPTPSLESLCDPASHPIHERSQTSFIESNTFMLSTAYIPPPSQALLPLSLLPHSQNCMYPEKSCSLSGRWENCGLQSSGDLLKFTERSKFKYRPPDFPKLVYFT